MRPANPISIATVYRTATIVAAVTSHLSWTRSIPDERRNRCTRATREAMTPTGSMTMLRDATSSTGRSASDAEWVPVARERSDFVAELPRGQDDRQHDHRQAPGEYASEPAPAAGREMSVREQQEQERRGTPHDRHPHGGVQRDRDQPEMTTADAAVDRIARVRPEERTEPDRRPDPHHEPAERVVRSAYGHQVPHDREQTEGQQQPESVGSSSIVESQRPTTIPRTVSPASEAGDQDQPLATRNRHLLEAVDPIHHARMVAPAPRLVQGR